ncbi:MAG: hypothetical protein IPI49_12455 [Myxococcales bacterium]|nr:hypothetical protein [Myxococcales bacterium]
MDDDDIREVLRRGETRKAMGMVAERYQREVYGRCWQFLRNSEDARDARQQTWTAMLRHGDKLLGGRSNHGSCGSRVESVSTCCERVIVCSA